MEHITEVNFADVQAEERYKRLERSLKLASLRKKNRSQNKSRSLAISPIASNVNSETFDFDSKDSFSETSRIDSEILSGNNLKNIMSKQNRINGDHITIATSSMKKFNTRSDSQNDCLMMPPPKCSNHFHNSKKLKNMVTDNVTKSFPQDACIISDVSIESPKGKQTYKFPNTNGKYISTSNYPQNSLDNFQNRNGTTFTKWKVMLNEQGQLIIKGTLECGKIARSKPIRKRLTFTNIESICKHLYHLQGNIVDDEYALPQYVKDKFYNGFPDDWQNVHQIWKKFVEEGCSKNFRWPTFVTDSDNDLRSDITFDTNSPSPEALDRNCHKKSSACEIPLNSEYTYILQTKAKQNSSLDNYKKTDSFTQTCACDVNNECFMSQYSNDKENYKLHKSCGNCSCIRSKANMLIDKLNIIVNNATGNIHSQEYTTKITQIFDRLNDVFSDELIKENVPNIEDLRLKQNKHVLQKRKSKTINDSSEYAKSEEISLKNSRDNKVTDHNLLQRKRMFAEMNKENKNSNSDGESETYTGIPKISIEQVMQKRKIVLKPHKRKVREEQMNQNYDSSVSIIEDKKDHIKEKNYMNLVTKNKIDKHIESNTTKRGKLDKSNNFIIDRNMHEMQDHFVQKSTTIIHKSPTHVCSVIKNDEYMLPVAKRAESNMININTSIDVTNEKQDINIREQDQNHPYDQQSEEHSAKPSIINTITFDRGTTTRHSQHFLQNKEVDLVENGNEIIKDLDDGIRNENLMRKRSPIKSDVINKMNSNSVFYKDKHSEGNAEVQSINVNSTNSKNSPMNALEVSERNDSEATFKPKSLSSWTPKVLSKQGLHLIFQGTLLNELGQIMQKRFETGIVLRRISPTLIETVEHEFYELVGDMNVKHDIPKKLLKLCRYGCPSRIEQFCRTWQSLQSDTEEKLNNTMSGDAISVGVSSKGRRIIPPLSYWTGERISCVENDMVYQPGNFQDSLVSSSHDNHDKSKQAKQQRKDKNNQSNSNKSKNMTSPKVLDKKVTTNYEIKENNNTKQFTIQTRGTIQVDLNSNICDSLTLHLTDKRNTRSMNTENLVRDSLIICSVSVLFGHVNITKCIDNMENYFMSCRHLFYLIINLKTHEAITAQCTYKLVTSVHDAVSLISYDINLFPYDLLVLRHLLHEPSMNLDATEVTLPKLKRRKTHHISPEQRPRNNQPTAGKHRYTVYTYYQDFPEKDILSDNFSMVTEASLKM
ncbi:uncharacterized protein LOC143430126 [Xylocopa sonorina]|uniref:uncharacterized protein LOC143430126 n=1 Tax=Xylocopa sonorina TaxID=1818115 RepID=UPI00403B1E14